MGSIKNILKSILILLMITGMFSQGCTLLDRFKKKTPTPTEPKPVETVEEVEPPPLKKTKTDDYVHTVRWPGETLSIIAMWYTGESAKWKELADANPKLNPNLIYMGDEIVIPASLLKIEKPLTRSFVQQYAPPPHRAIRKVEKTDPDQPGNPTPPKSPSKNKKQADEKLPEPFGPK
jgi:hypothetical protein